MTPDEEQALLNAATAAAHNAHAPYSEFAVGAALRTVGGRVFDGCNVENASYGLTICAERVAIFNAIVAGSREFEALAVASSGAAPPCGACRQVLAEFAESLPVLLIDTATGERQVTDLRDLLPNPFRLR